MHKSVNLLLAAGLAASGFASTAAAQQADACDSANTPLATAGEGFETQISGQSAAVNYSGIRTVSRFVIDTDAAKAKVTFGLSYSGSGQYNMRIHDADNNELARIEPSAGSGTVSVKMSDCTDVIVYVYAEQAAGGPTSPMVNVTFTGVE